jgi:transposase
MKPLSHDIRERIVSTYQLGNTSIRKIAIRFQVSPTTVQKLLRQQRETGNLMPKKARGGKPSHLAGHEQEIQALVEEHPDYTLSEYCETWEDRGGVRLSQSAMCRFLQGLKLTRKKNETKS